MNNTIKKNPSVIWKKIDGEIVLLNPKKGDYFGLEKVGASFWELIDDTSDVNSIIRRLLDQYDVKEDVLTKDIMALIEKMENRGLINLI